MPIPFDKPSELEMQVLGVLWRAGTATVREILGAMPDGKKRAYTTLLSTMQGMEAKGLLIRTREGLTDRWRPAMPKSRVLGPFFRSLVANVFGGRAIHAMQHLLQETDVSDEELAEIRKLLENHQSQRDAVKNAPKKRKHP
jgi:BlaI family transcriptional regulator, penicillinase repressor